MKNFLFVLFILVSLSSFSQKKKLYRVTNDKGTFFLSYGFNRTVYSMSNLYLVGNGYNFNLERSKATDNQSKFGSGDYALNSISIPQYNFKLGYYYKKKWSIAFAVDHMKYIFADNNHVIFSGNTSFIVQEVAFGNDGQTFSNSLKYSESVTTNKEQFRFENSKGLNYIHAELGLAERLYVKGKRGNFCIASNTGFGAGVLYSYTTLLYNNIQGKTAKSLSGYGLSAFAGLRCEVYKRAFIYTNFSLGFLHKVHEKSNAADPSAIAKQKFGYSQIEIGLGIFLYRRMKNGCGGCPVW